MPSVLGTITRSAVSGGYAPRNFTTVPPKPGAMTNNIAPAGLELEARTRWALARIAELVNAGRTAAWLPGEPLADVGSADAFLALAMDQETPMRLLVRSLRLSEVAQDVLWFLACVELEPRIARAMQFVLSPGMLEIDAQMLERLITRGAGFDTAVLEQLAQLGLIETSLDARLPLFRRFVRVADRVLDLARGRLGLDRELAGFSNLASAVEVRREIAKTVPDAPPFLANLLVTQRDPLVVAQGRRGSGRATLLRHAIATAGRRVLTVRATGLSSDHTMLARQLRALNRECQLHDAWPLLLDIDDLTDRAAIIDRELFAAFPGPVLATAREACTWPVSRVPIRIEVKEPNPRTSADLWRHALPEATADVIAQCAERYTLLPGVLMRTAAAARAAAGTVPIGAEVVHAALRSQVEQRLLGLASHVETRQTWDDLVLPVDQFDMLIELVARVRHRNQVLDSWGFADKIGRGYGLSTLLSGPPGTGKTMIAGLLARELSLDLYQVDLSRIVSKYIGETEKQLAELFDAAESGHAILLFDEADSLFAKRTEVKSSNDRYANLEVNYLLQRMESFNGISLLTTNHETAIDSAFMRRLAFHIRVPMPDENQRRLLWESMIPSRAERASDLDVTRLASEFVMSGGYIKNAVLRAAFLAASERQPISNAHLWRAARSEYEGMGKVALPARTCREAC